MAANEEKKKTKYSERRKFCFIKCCITKFRNHRYIQPRILVMHKPIVEDLTIGYWKKVLNIGAQNTGEKMEKMVSFRVTQI